MSAAPLIWADDLEAPLAWREGKAISRRQYLADVQQLALQLPEGGAMLNLTGDRYRFAVGLGAAMLRGQGSLQREHRQYQERDRKAHTVSGG